MESPCKRTGSTTDSEDDWNEAVQEHEQEREEGRKRLPQWLVAQWHVRGVLWRTSKEVHRRLKGNPVQSGKQVVRDAHQASCR